LRTRSQPLGTFRSAPVAGARAASTIRAGPEPGRHFICERVIPAGPSRLQNGRAAYGIGILDRTCRGRRDRRPRCRLCRLHAAEITDGARTPPRPLSVLPLQGGRHPCQTDHGRDLLALQAMRRSLECCQTSAIDTFVTAGIKAARDRQAVIAQHLSPRGTSEYRCRASHRSTSTRSCSDTGLVWLPPSPPSTTRPASAQ
jgi:hypothetical protein